jgi:glycosyltransferase involved in cell wall biosynthesis
MRRVPVVSVRHFAAPRGGNRVNRAVAGIVGRLIGGQIAISRFVADAIEGESVVVHTGVADAADVDERAREPFALVLQRLEAEKATDVAIRAWAAMPVAEGWRLVIAGEGGEEAALRRLARELGVEGSVDFVGFQADVQDWLRRASVLIAPTPREGLGLAVLEAMAQGVPVVAAAGGGHLETVGSVPDAALFPPGDAEAAAELLAGLVRDGDRRRDYGRALRERRRAAFTVAAQTELTVAVLRSAARSPAP